MKKFHFSLDSVLKYKDQVLDTLKNDYARILARVMDKEKELEEAITCHREEALRFDVNKRNGASICEMQQIEYFLQSLDVKIDKLLKELEVLKTWEKQVRNEMIEAKKETSSMEKLREKKLEEYITQYRKKEEVFIEEFVSYSRSVQV